MFKKVPKQARSEHLVGCILAGATRVLNAAPLAETTTNRIAEVAGVSIGSLYQYFDGKEAIALCLLQQHLDHTVALLRDARIASRGCRLEERMRMPFVEILRDHRSQPMLHLNLIALPQRDEVSASRLRASVDRMIDEIALALAEERPDARPDEIRLCATLRHQSSTLLAHAAIRTPDFDRDSVVMDYFDTLSAANIMLLDHSAAAR
jgi:AcrR family transcriptional regulator